VVVAVEASTWQRTSFLQVRGREIGENAAAVDDRFWLTKRYHQDCLG